MTVRSSVTQAFDSFKRWFARYRPPRKLRVTREGKWYLGVTLGVGIAAINTGNNLLYLLLGLLLSLVVISGAMSEVSLRQLTVVRRLPLRSQVGRSHLVEIEVYNNKKQIPSYAIEVEDLREGQPADKRCFFLKISPSSTQVAAYRRTPQRRGRDRHVGFRIATRFPFGLFEKSREIPSEGELIIYPAVDPVRIQRKDGGRPHNGDGRIGQGSGDEIAGIRPEREGDDPRDIYWRKSTLPGHRVMRERAREMSPETVLHLDVFRPLGMPQEEADARFERAVRDVASRAVAYVKAGDRVTVSTSSRHRLRVDRSSGIDPVLRFLALVEARDVTTETSSPVAPGEPPAPGPPRQAAE
jgi:uncharacterized protein (DUF58 family)